MERVQEHSSEGQKQGDGIPTLRELRQISFPQGFQQTNGVYIGRHIQSKLGSLKYQLNSSTVF